MTASYVNLLENGELARRAAQLRERLQACDICPHACGVNRLEGEGGRCRTGATARVSSANDHHGEEPPISGSRGSGTIFFTNCNLRCEFCQNYPISQQGHGNDAPAERLGGMMLALQERGCHNINWVTPTHVTPQAVEGLLAAARRGLTVPIVYNSGGYESVDVLRLLDGIVDIYMPDIKYGDNAEAEQHSGAPDYFDRARDAVREMHRQVGDLKMDGEGIAAQGLLVRHLVLPGDVSRSEAVFAFLAREVSPGTYVSIMDQYFPAHRATAPPMNRRVTWEEYEQALDAAERHGITRGWVQGRSEEME